MPFCISGRRERIPRSLQQPIGDRYDSGAVPPSRRCTRLQERCRDNSRYGHICDSSVSRARHQSVYIYLYTGPGKHRRLLNVSELAKSLGEEYCANLMGCYVFSGEDCTSAFKGKGKMGPLRKLEKNPRFHSAFRQLGVEWNIQTQRVKQLEEFTCLMYGQSRESYG